MSMLEDNVQKHLRKITVLLKKAVRLTDREMSLLAVALCEMELAGLRPYEQQFLVQVDPWISF